MPLPGAGVLPRATLLPGITAPLVTSIIMLPPSYRVAVFVTVGGRSLTNVSCSRAVRVSVG